MSAGIDMDPSAVIARDRASNPDCGYSTSESTSCRSTADGLKCETLRQIFRRCPGKRHELLHSFKHAENSDADSSSHGSPIIEGGGGGRAGAGAGDRPFGSIREELDNEIDQVLRPLEGVFGMRVGDLLGSLFGGGGGGGVFDEHRPRGGGGGAAAGAAGGAGGGGLAPDAPDVPTSGWARRSRPPPHLYPRGQYDPSKSSNRYEREYGDAKDAESI